MVPSPALTVRRPTLRRALSIEGSAAGPPGEVAAKRVDAPENEELVAAQTATRRISTGSGGQPQRCGMEPDGGRPRSVDAIPTSCRIDKSRPSRRARR